MTTPRTRLTELATQPTTMGGLGSNMRRLKNDGAATIGELREFLGKMRGRSPQDVLGAVAQSSLFRCTVWTIVGTFVVMTAGTLIPHQLGWGKKEAKKVEKPASAAAAPAATVAPGGAQAGGAQASGAQTGDAATVATDGDAKAGSDSDGKPDLKKAAKKMGLDETKQADPKKNPLDKDVDKLLDLK